MKTGSRPNTGWRLSSVRERLPSLRRGAWKIDPRLSNRGVFLDIRDRMNTPLQVIELSVDVLRNSRQPTDQTLDRIDRSVESLKNINSMLVEHEKEIEWEAER